MRSWVIATTFLSVCLAANAGSIDDMQRLRARAYVLGELEEISRAELISAMKEDYWDWSFRQSRIPKPSGLFPFMPSLRPDMKYKYWIVLEDVTYYVGNSDYGVTIPAGFVTDLASIPQVLWSTGLTPQGKYGFAAILHDYLYWSQQCSRSQADAIFAIAMKEAKVDEQVVQAIYQGVRIGGQQAWDANDDEKKRGLLKIVPDFYRKPPPSRSWPEHRRILFENGVRDPSLVHDGTYCRFGDTLEIPEVRRRQVAGHEQVRRKPLAYPVDYFYDFMKRLRQLQRVVD